MLKEFMTEYDVYDGEAFITFNIVDINYDNNTVTVAVTNRGKISVITYDLMKSNEKYYFEYGVMLTHIYISDFMEVA